jgi:hypothetical protein
MEAVSSSSLLPAEEVVVGAEEKVVVVVVLDAMSGAEERTNDVRMCEGVPGRSIMTSALFSGLEQEV